MAIKQQSQLVLLQPQGRLDLEGSKLLEQQLDNLQSQIHTLWVIDLAQVDFMNSSGLFSLVTALKAARKSRCRLVLCNIQPPVRLVLELTQLDSVFEIFESYDAILTTFKAPVLAA